MSNSISDNWGYLPNTVFWESGRLKMIRHCEGVFELFCDGIQVMPTNSFDTLSNYLWAEFSLPGFNDC